MVLHSESLLLNVIPKWCYFKPCVRFHCSGISSWYLAVRLIFKSATVVRITSMGISRRITIPSMSDWGSMSSAGIRRPGFPRIGSSARVRLVFQRWHCAWRPRLSSIGRIRMFCFIRPRPTNAAAPMLVSGTSLRECMAFNYRK